MDAEEQQTYLQQRRSSHDGASSSTHAGAVPDSPSPSAAGPSPRGRPSSDGGIPGPGSSYHFICECFFLTAKGLHLGLIQAITECGDVHRVSGAPCKASLKSVKQTKDLCELCCLTNCNLYLLADDCTAYLGRSDCCPSGSNACC